MTSAEDENALMSGTADGLWWAPVMPLALAIPAVGLAFVVPVFWVFAIGAFAFAFGRYGAWRRAARSCLIVDASGLALIEGGRQVRWVSWHQVVSVRLWPGSSSPRWSTGPQHGGGALPRVVAILQGRTFRGDQYTEDLGSFLILDREDYGTGRDALARVCQQHDVPFREGW